MDVLFYGAAMGSIIGLVTGYIIANLNRPAEWANEPELYSDYQPAPAPSPEPIAVTRLTRRERTIEL